MRAFFEKLEQYFLPFILGRPTPKPRDMAITCFLFVASRFYRMVTQFRIWLYDRRFFRYRALGCLVVSIGNLTCGGTGKTPVVEVFARSLSQKGRKVAILSRGYRSKKKSLTDRLRAKLPGADIAEDPPKIVSDEERVLLNSEYAGDEPFMLASNLPGVVVLVDKDRVKSGLYAIDKFQTDTLILDDGFQYLRLRPHINIVLVDSTSPFGNHHVLPRGILREPIKNIRRADYVFLTKSKGGHRNEHLRRFIRKHNSRAEIIECCHMPQYLSGVYDHKRQELSYISGKKVAALSGIANPVSFENFIRELGGEVVYTEHFVDHHRYSEAEIENFARTSRQAGAELLLTTEKDAVRIPKISLKHLEFMYLRIQIDILSGQENFDQCISRICFM